MGRLLLLGIALGCATANPVIAQSASEGEFVDLTQVRGWEQLSGYSPGSATTSGNSQDLVDRLVIKLRERRVYLYRGGDVVGSYPVAIGKAGWETPVGRFSVQKMIVDPAWQHPWNGKIFPPGKGNPLGRRWIGFWTDGKDVIGFHGTPNENSVGQAASHGCVRMKNADIAQLFEQVRVGTPVIVEQ